MRVCKSLALCIIVAALTGGRASAEVPAAIAAPGETTVATFHAEGAQIYECKAGNDGKLAWAFREPIATLLLEGKTVGRHYAGPNWEHIDGSAVTAKAAGTAPGKTASDIPWLKLEVTGHRGSGTLSGVTTVQRRAGRCLRQSRYISQRAVLGGVRVPAQGILERVPTG
jgi:Protein of unknown function (DUF3455)